jgi:hypothetical protein
MEIPMNHIRRIRRLAAALAGALLAFAAAAPAALARPGPPGLPLVEKHPPLPSQQVVIIGGMPGWQIALIAAGAALLAAAVAVLAYRAWTTRRKSATAAV